MASLGTHILGRTRGSGQDMDHSIVWMDTPQMDRRDWGSGARGCGGYRHARIYWYKVYGPTDDGPKGLGSGARWGGGTDTW